jgi:hypothetical protein
MADQKISQLTAATTPLAGTEVLPIVQGGATVKVSVDNLTIGKPVKALNFNAIGTNAGPSYRMADWEIIRYVNAVADVGGWTAGQWSTLRLWANGSIGATIDSSLNVTIDAGNLIIGTAGKGVSLPGGITWTSGSGSPEGVVTAPVGSLYSRSDGGLLTSLYVKQSGSGNTGWAGK